MAFEAEPPPGAVAKTLVAPEKLPRFAVGIPLLAFKGRIRLPYLCWLTLLSRQGLQQDSLLSIERSLIHQRRRYIELPFYSC